MNEGTVRAALQIVADDVVEYPVLRPALRRARRARAVRLAAIPVGMGLMVLAILLVVPAVSAPVVVASPPPDASGLPERIDAPVAFTPSVADAPPGPVALVMAGSRRPPTRAVTVSAAGHRLVDWGQGWPARPGENLLLSPDGTRLAWDGVNGEVHLLDLRTGEERTIRRNPGGDLMIELVAWTPDGAFVAYAEMRRPTGVNSPPAELVGIGLLDVVTGRYRRVIETTGAMPTERPAFAFSPDGLRVAYRLGDRLHVAGLGGRDTWSVAMPRGAVLAGKAAWTPDGSAVAIAVPEDCCAAAVTVWRLEFFSADTGSPRTDLAFPPVHWASLIRLAGWNPAGAAVVVAYVGRDYPGPLDGYASRTDFDLVRRAEVVALDPGSADSRVLLSAPDGIEALDVSARSVASGRVAAVPRPPVVLDPAWWWAFGGGAVVLAQIVVAFVAVAVMRARRRRSPLAVHGPDGGIGRPYGRTAP